MSIPQIQRIGVNDKDLSRIQDNIARAVDVIGAKPILDGVLIEGVVLTSGSAALVPHSLGRPYRGWIVVKKRPTTAPPSTSIYIWDIDLADNLKTSLLSMWTSVNCTVSLWVF
jgi:hypothetical protein